MASTANASAYAAVGAYQGFTLQDVRLAYHLLSVPPGHLVSIEHKDDVAIHRPDGSLIYEQIKSAQKTNPLTDSAPDLWKTLANWGAVFKSGPKISDRFQLYVVPQRTGPIAMQIHSAKSDADADAVILAACDLLKKKLGKEASKQLKRFLALSSDIKREVIKKTTILNTDNDEYEPLHQLMGVALPSKIIESAARYIIGYAQTTARKMMKAEVSAILSGDQCKAELQDFVMRTNMQRLLPSDPKPDQTEVDAQLQARPVFVQQMELIKAQKEHMISAVADYLQASATRASWAADGLVVESTLHRWNYALVSAHANYHMGVAAGHSSKSPDQRGQILLSQCCLHKEKLDASDVGSEFIRGSFHNLADLRVLGWHEDFKILLGVEV